MCFNLLWLGDPNKETNPLHLTRPRPASSVESDVPKQDDKGKHQEEEEQEREQNMSVGICRVSRVPVALRRYR